MLETGLRAYLEGRFEAAIGAFDELAGKAPESPRLRLLLGMALHGAWVMGEETDDELIRRSRSELDRASRLDPGLVPDPALCPPRVKRRQSDSSAAQTRLRPLSLAR